METIRILPFLSIVLSSLIIVSAFPCPPECICEPSAMIDMDFTRMRYAMHCGNVSLNDGQLIYNAEPWSVADDTILDDDDDDFTNEYQISIDLTNAASLERFDQRTIQFTGFSFTVESLSLANQSSNFSLVPHAFNATIYQTLHRLNLSSCCQKIPAECQRLFLPLKKLQVLDLSGSDMYRRCLGTPGTISSTLRDLLLQRNDFDTTTFSHTSHLFDGVRHTTGKLDLQYSRFQMGTQLTGNCLFDLFNEITALDLSHVEFLSIANDTDVHLKHLLKCKASTDRPRQGEQLLDLFLRQLNLQSLPDWLTYDRFPRLAQLDLSHNNIHTIDLSAFTNLYRISLAFNPLELHDIGWRANTVYKSINLRSTIQNRNFNLTANLENLFKITTNIDYSGNMGSSSFSLAKFPVAIDFPLDGLSLNISHMNISSFDTKGFSQFDDLARLDISANQLIALNLEQQGKLAYLDCSNQNLTSLTLNGDHSDLVELRCARNQLATIENFSLHKHETLKSIDLSYNAVESLESFFSNTNSRHLHSVRFQSNVIKKIPAKTFHPKLISLYLIDLSWNQINSIERAAIQSPNLQILDLTGNPLKSIEPNFLFTASLRLFFIVNSSQELIDRCAQSTSDDTLLVNYMTWYEQNGTHMNSNPRQRAEEIQFDKCLRRYTSRSKVKWTKLSDGHQIKHWSLYVTMAAISTGIVLGTIHLYRKHKLAQQTSLQRYRPLNSHTLVENADDCQPEDDEIVLNLNESPFRTIH